MLSLYSISLSQNEQFKDKKILIISLQATGGHKAVSDALQAALHMNGIQCKVIYVDAYEYFKIFSAQQIEAICQKESFYTNQHFNITLVANYCRQNSLLSKYCSTLNINTHAIKQQILQIQPDIIISVCYIASYAVSKILSSIQKICKKTIPVVIIPTDLSAKIIPWFVKPKHDHNLHYLTCSPMLYWETVNQYHAYQNVKIHNINGLPLRQIPQISQEQAREELRISHNKKVITICFGSVGNQAMIEYMLYAMQHDQQLIDKKRQYILIFGKAQNLADQAQKLLQNTSIGDDQIRILGFTQEMLKYIIASDICIGKAGPTFITECVSCCTVPLIFATIAHEQCTILHFHHAQNIGVVSKLEALDILQKINLILANHEFYQQKLKTYVPNIEYIRQELQDAHPPQDIQSIINKCHMNTGTQDAVQYIENLLYTMFNDAQSNADSGDFASDIDD